MSRVLAQDSMSQVLFTSRLGGTTVIMPSDGVTVPDAGVVLAFSDTVVTISELSSGDSSMTTVKPAALDIVPKYKQRLETTWIAARMRK